MHIEPFRVIHLDTLKLQHAQAYLSGWVSQKQGEFLETQQSFTVIDGDTPIASGGVISQWAGRGIAWAFLSDIGPRDFLMIHRAVERFLDNCGFNRVEISVDCDFPAAHRWARLLGFEMEANCMRGYGPDGRDCALYARLLS
jgi:hypothetical protein